MTARLAARTLAAAFVAAALLAGTAPAADAGTRCVHVNDEVVCVDY